MRKPLKKKLYKNNCTGSGAPYNDDITHNNQKRSDK